MFDEKQNMQAVFDQIHADERLLRRTKAHLRGKTLDYGRDLPRLRQRKKRLVGTAAALALSMVLLCVNLVPVSTIHLDVNPSIELKCNLRGRIIAAAGLNEDGRALTSRLDLNGRHYSDAVRRILFSDEMEPYLTRSSTISITVTGSRQAANHKMLKNLVCSANQVAEEQTLYYSQVEPETARAAKAAGLCPFRYLALLKLREQDPEADVSDVMDLSAERIRELAGFDVIENPCGE